MGASDHCDKTHQYSVGDKIWVHVDDVNSPTGWWHGEVISVDVPSTGYDQSPRIQVKLTDLRLEYEQELHPTKVNLWFNRQPSVNFNIYPRNPYTDYLIGSIVEMKKNIDNLNWKHSVREKALMDAFAAIGGKNKI